jgi:hypothetical protein
MGAFNMRPLIWAAAVLVLLNSNLWATRFTVAQSGNVSSGSTFVGGVAPDCTNTSKDTIDVPANSPPYALTIDTNCILGDNATQVGHAIHVYGSDPATYGELLVNSGVTLTVACYDTSTNDCLLTDRYALFEPAGSSAITMRCPGNGNCQINLNGMTHDDQHGTDSKVNWTSDPANYSWSTVASNVTLNTQAASMDMVHYPNYKSLIFPYPFIANAAGTGPGSAGDSSITGISVSGCTPSCTFTSEKTSWTQIQQQGDYYVDYEKGLVFVWSTGNSLVGGGTATYKHLTVNAGSIAALGSGTYSELLLNNSAFTYLGSATGSVLQVGDKDTTGTHQGFRLTNSTFYFNFGSLVYNPNSYPLITNAANPVVIDSNIFSEFYTPGAYGVAAINIGYANNLDYVIVTNNIINYSVHRYNGGNETLTKLAINANASPNVLNQPITRRGWVVKRNVGDYCALFYGTLFRSDESGMDMEENLSYASGGQTQCPGTVWASGLQGTGTTDSTQVLVQYNATLNTYKSYTIGTYNKFLNNYVANSTHHGVIPEDNGDGSNYNFLHDSVLLYNIFTGGASASLAQWAYALSTVIDNLTFGNNYLGWAYDASGQGSPWVAFDFGDSRDAPADNATSAVNWPVGMHSNVYFYSNSGDYNQVEAGHYACARFCKQVTAPLIADYNQYYHNAKQEYCTGLTDTQYHPCDFNGFASFKLAGVHGADYGLATRNVIGVVLSDPTYTTNQPARDLVYTVNTWPTDVTLSWGGGAAVQIVHYTGTGISGASNILQGKMTTMVGVGTTTQTYQVALGDATNPVGDYIVITGGTGSGQMRRVAGVCNNPGNYEKSCLDTLPTTSGNLIVVPAWSVLPDASSTWVLFKSEVKLYDSGRTDWVRAGITPWSTATLNGSGGVPSWQIPTTSQMDSNIYVVFNMNNLNPNYQSYSGNVQTYGVWQSASSTWDTGACNLGTWYHDTQSGTWDEPSALAAIKVDPSLVKSSFLPYIQNCHKMVLTSVVGNCGLATAGYDGSYIGAVPPSTAGCGKAIPIVNRRGK